MKFKEGHWYYNPEYIEIPTFADEESSERKFDGFNAGYYLCSKEYDLILLSTPYDRHGDSAYAGQLKGIELKDLGTSLPKEIAKEYPEYAKGYATIQNIVR